MGTVLTIPIRCALRRDDQPSGGRTHGFDLPVPAATAAPAQYPDKAKRKEAILALRAQGWSYRRIAAEVGLHWTRVGQIIKVLPRRL